MDDLLEKVAGVIRRHRMVAYEDGKGGWLWREATDIEIAIALRDANLLVLPKKGD